jgi:hypothetical protein
MGEMGEYGGDREDGEDRRQEIEPIYRFWLLISGLNLNYF